MRVIDASGREGAYAGKLFADMGAEVVRLRAARNEALSPEMIFDLGKETVIADPGTRAGVETFCTLAGKADVVIESFAPGTLESFGRGREPLQEKNPGLIWARISPFGPDGPYRDYRSTDLTNMALGGMLTLAGYPDRAPVLAAAGQSFKIASLYCAAAVLIAYFERMRSSRGQYIEVPIQHAVATALENSIQFYDLQGVVRKRTGPGYAEAASGLFRCRDGFVFLMAGRLSTLRGWKSLITWLAEQMPGRADELLEPRWEDQGWKATPEAAHRFEAIFTEFAANRTKLELYLEAQRRGIAMCPVNSVADVIEDTHLRARGFFRSVQLPGGVVATLPGVPYRLSETPAELAVRTQERVGDEV